KIPYISFVPSKTHSSTSSKNSTIAKEIKKKKIVLAQMKHSNVNNGVNKYAIYKANIFWVKCASLCKTKLSPSYGKIKNERERERERERTLGSKRWRNSNGGCEDSWWVAIARPRRSNQTLSALLLVQFELP
ncbi:hypothetical protein PanWU01x14_045200, partial [Parasponia andersonii]